MYKKTKLAVALAAISLASAGAWAGQPGETNPGSTTDTVSASAVTGFLTCALRAVDRDRDFGNIDGPPREARARAIARALSRLRMVAGGQIDLTLTRHGKNGAVHQMQLDAATRNMRTALVVSRSSAAADVDADAEAIAEALADATAEADASVWDGIPEVCFPIVGCIIPRITFSEAIASGYGDASAVGFGIASASAEGESDGSASSGARLSSVGRSSSSVYVQGANIEEFEAEVGASDASFLRINTSAIEHALVSAYTVAMASADADADASASAYTGGLLVANESDTDTDTDSDSDSEDNSVYADAAADARAIAGMLARSRLRVTLKASFENLPGIDDKFEALARTRARLDCSTWARASAEADAFAGTVPPAP